MNNAQQLPISIKKAWLLYRCFNILIILLLMLISSLLVSKFIPTYLWLTWLVFGLGFLYESLTILLIPYHYKFWRYQITANYVYLQSGFFFRKHTTIPINRVQNVNLNQGPILRIFKLQAVAIVTAATDFTIDGITEVEANALSQQIITTARKAREENVYSSTST